MADVSLREYLESKIKALENHIDLRFEAVDKALQLQAKLDKEQFEAIKTDQRYKRAEWLAIVSLILWAATVIVMLMQWRQG